jgi:hypothetical protein
MILISLILKTIFYYHNALFISILYNQTEIISDFWKFGKAKIWGLQGFDLQKK